MKSQINICIVLAILIVLIIGYAAMNGGKLWGEPENYYQTCTEDSICKTINGSNSYCKKSDNPINPFGQCVK
jgi:hypothetical protein